MSSGRSRNSRELQPAPEVTTSVDRKASRQALDAFANSVGEVLGTELVAELRRSLREASRGGEEQALESVVEGARHRVLVVGEALSDADLEVQRKALKVQSTAHTLKLETSRKASDVRVVNVKAEVEHTFQKKFEEQVAELSSGEGGTAKLLKQALEKADELGEQLEEVNACRARAECVWRA